MEDISNIIFTGDTNPGYTRKKRGKGFAYLDENNTIIADTAIKKRIQTLIIPPNWTNVWICPQPNGHIQVTGRDEKGRKQYIYHAAYRASRQSEKFSKLSTFAHLLPKIRATNRQYLNKRDWTKEKVLALVVQILDALGIRIGNAYYKETNDSFGLTTLRRKHLLVEGDTATFSFKGKSNKYHKLSLKNKKLSKLVKECSELPGHELFRYIGEDGKWHTLTSHDVNTYLTELTDAHISSKDFRTWAGTSLAVFFYPEMVEEKEMNKSRSTIDKMVVKQVAKSLGNTTKVCRKYYIHPNVLTAITNETLPSWKLPANIPTETALPELVQELEDYELLTLEVIQQEVAAE